MENAVEALKTAAAVLVFIIALTVAFTMFSKAKITTDAIVTMQDKQEYLEAAGLEDILYTSSDKITSGSYSGTMTTKGDRIVGIDDVISTIYRYNVEKYGVTIIESDGTVLARFDSNTENIIRQWYNIQGLDINNDGDTNDTDEKSADEVRKDYALKLQSNLQVPQEYLDAPSTKIDLDEAEDLVKLYEIEVDGGSSQIKCGAPWYGNQTEIIKRCNCEIKGSTYDLYGDGKITYETKIGTESLYDKLTEPGKKIIEAINEIDTSKYLEDATDGKTNLLQQYQLPTTEIIYIIK